MFQSLVSEERREQMRELLEVCLRELREYPKSSRHLAVYSIQEVDAALALLEGVHDRLPAGKGLYLDVPTNESRFQFQTNASGHGQLKLRLVPEAEAAIRYSVDGVVVWKEPSPRSGAPSLEGLETQQPRGFNACVAIQQTIQNLREGRDRRFSDLPWEAIRDEIEEAGERVVVKITRLDPGNAEVLRKFCGHDSSREPAGAHARLNEAEELTGERLNQIASLLKYALGQEHAKHFGTDRHPYKISLLFERFHEERYFKLWDFAYHAVELAGLTGETKKFYIAAPYEGGIVRRFLSVLESSCDRNFVYRIPDDNHSRLERDYPKAVFVDPRKKFELRQGAEQCQFKPSLDGHKRLEVDDVPHIATRLGVSERAKYQEGKTEAPVVKEELPPPLEETVEYVGQCSPAAPELHSPSTRTADYLRPGSQSYFVYRFLHGANGGRPATKAIDDFVLLCSERAASFGLPSEEFGEALFLALERLLGSYAESLEEIPEKRRHSSKKHKGQRGRSIEHEEQERAAGEIFSEIREEFSRITAMLRDSETIRGGEMLLSALCG